MKNAYIPVLMGPSLTSTTFSWITFHTKSGVNI